LELLVAKSGNSKKRVMKICQILQGSRGVDDDMVSKKRKRSSLATSAFVHVLFIVEVYTLVDTPKFNMMVNRLVDNILKKIGDSSIDLASMLQTCDMIAILYRGYGEIYKIVQGRIGIPIRI